MQAVVNARQSEQNWLTPRSLEDTLRCIKLYEKGADSGAMEVAIFESGVSAYFVRGSLRKSGIKTSCNAYFVRGSLRAWLRT